MKKIFLFTIMIFYFISTNVYGNTPKEVSEKELVEIYTVAFDSFVPQKKYLENKNYIAIDMSTSLFDSISQKSKQQILEYFKNKYNKEVMNASLDMLKEKGLTKDNLDYLKSNGKYGVLLMIEDVNFKSESEVVSNGLWFTSGISAKFYKSTIVLKNGKWILKEKIMTGIS